MNSTNPEPDEPSFEAFPHAPAYGQPVRKRSRVTKAIYTVIALAVVGTTAAVMIAAPKAVDPNAPRVTVNVEGLHCPIQCGLRVSNSLEKLPWVVPGSVTANPATGEVTFAVTSKDAVNKEELAEAIEKAGFSLD